MQQFLKQLKFGAADLALTVQSYPQQNICLQSVCWASMCPLYVVPVFSWIHMN